MGWFDEQIRQRKQKDEEVFAEAFVNIAGAVMGKRFASAMKDDRQAVRDAIDEILKFYHIKSREVPDTLHDLREQLEYLMRPYGVMRRNVRLQPGWHRDAVGAMLGTRKDDGSVTALIPAGFSGYRFFDRASGKYQRVTRGNAALFDEEAICFYKPFPLKKMRGRDLMGYIMQTLRPSDGVLVVLATLAVTAIGLLGPKLNNVIFSSIITGTSLRPVLAMTVFLCCVSISMALFSSVRSLLIARITTKMDIAVEAATMMRLLSLPASFFKSYTSGELFQRTQYLNAICDSLVTVVFSTGLSGLFSLLYLSQIFVYTPALVQPALLVVAATIGVTLVSILVQMNMTKRQMLMSAKESGVSYSLISGIQKIKLAGAEKRAFAHWGNLYAKVASLTYDSPLLVRLTPVADLAISLGGTILIYYTAVTNAVTVADYYAFNTAYAMVTGALLSLAGIGQTIAQLKPTFEMVRPILEAVPEIGTEKQVLTRLSGSIELDNVSFRYSDNMPNVLDKLSLKIHPGQYVAIVGSTGCGKSTLMRLMLGFETPQKGAVYYDGKDLNTIDLKSLRRKIGVVMQDGKLFQGDIFSNITISAPWLTMEDAWQAAELAGMAEDIRQMPMGMHTLIPEGGGGMSGGQRQRLMIARAIAPRPRILMFDEATSALDNLTQKRVAESLDGLKCTRIVIAHRLSTIRRCDRIIVLDGGRIVEDGTYDELIQAGGYFMELISRQSLEDTPARSTAANAPEPIS